MATRQRLSIAVVVTFALVASATALLSVFGWFGYRAIRAAHRDGLRTEHRNLADQGHLHQRILWRRQQRRADPR